MTNHKLIKTLIARRYGSVSAWARSVGLESSLVYKVISGYTYQSGHRTLRWTCPRIRRAIAAALDMPIAHVWGPGSDVLLKQMLEADLTREALDAARAKLDSIIGTEAA